MLQHIGMRAQGERDGHIGRKVDSRTARIQKALLLWIISWQKFVVCVSRRIEHSLTPFFQCFDSVNILIGIDPEASSGRARNYITVVVTI